MAHKFNPKNKEKLDNPERRRTLPPKDTLYNLMLEEGDHVADIGCGIGYFTLAAAEIVGDKGRVFALDTSVEMLDYLKEIIEDKGIENIEIIKSEEHNANISDESIDFMLISNVMHEVEDIGEFLENYLNKMKANSKLAIIDWKKVKTKGGPPYDERISIEDLINILGDYNIELLKKVDLSNEQYALVGKKV
ncbi:class I SAM-dependent methyltransferase [Orenia marismortui]|uniref:Methyltransferase family protein n=1 Tax=Orenia marismortui TaxID=46469 RepID=A0A4R8GMB9_9FIRM|nr:methyltransferase domain-containing protein [Orenia marismortui]TDX46765.1 methyltransferase family protein [Orenia marismortui]